MRTTRLSPAFLLLALASPAPAADPLRQQFAREPVATSTGQPPADSSLRTGGAFGILFITLIPFHHHGRMDPSHASTSATLLGRLRLNPPDPTAWEEFARRYGPVVHRWCGRWRLQDADADDVTQTVLLTLVGRMREFEYDPAGSFRGWLKTVTYRAWARFLGDREKAAAGGDTVVELLHSVEARDDLAARLEQEYDRELLDRAMLLVAQRVESHTWEAFRLLAIEGLSGAEAADRLGLKVATAYVARSKVQKMIQEEIELMDRPTA